MTALLGIFLMTLDVIGRFMVMCALVVCFVSIAGLVAAWRCQSVAETKLLHHCLAQANGAVCCAPAAKTKPSKKSTQRA